MRIQVLPAHIANQIAAGEVIERPASVVKELLENALDAQATRIHVEILESGFHKIRVSDNGNGICEDDLPLAVATHATSKIREINDLNTVSTLGFRGEALASIAAISQFTVQSKPAEQAHGMQLSFENGAPKILPCPRNQGTTIDVREIFYNVPVRKKFLKSPRFEFLAIDRVLRCFALSAPTVHITFAHNGKQVLNIPAAMTLENHFARVQRLLGKSFMSQAYYVEEVHERMQLTGWICRPAQQRSQNDRQWLYVNGRMVKDKLLNHAVKQSYQNRSDPGRYPVCVLYLTLKPEYVDVNVHPTKYEVRFQDPRAVHNFICSTLTAILETASVSNVDLRLTENHTNDTHTPLANLRSFDPQEAFASIDAFDNVEALQTVVHEEKANVYPRNEGNCSTKYQSSYPYQTYRNETNKLPIKLQEPSFSSSWEKRETSWLGVNDKFALIVLERESYLVDIMMLRREWLLHVLAEEPLPLVSRLLAVPVRYCFDVSIQSQSLTIYQNLLEKIGIQLSMLGEKIALVRSVPCRLPHLDLQAFLKDFFKTMPSADVFLEEKWMRSHENDVYIDDEALKDLPNLQNTPLMTFLFKKLVQHDYLDTNYMSEEETKRLYEYCAFERALSPIKMPLWAKHLSLKSCEKWFND